MSSAVSWGGAVFQGGRLETHSVAFFRSNLRGPPQAREYMARRPVVSRDASNRHRNVNKLVGHVTKVLYTRNIVLPVRRAMDYCGTKPPHGRSMVL